MDLVQCSYSKGILNSEELTEAEIQSNDRNNTEGGGEAVVWRHMRSQGSPQAHKTQAQSS